MGATDLVNDVDHARGSIQADCATVPSRWGERGVAVMLRGPARNLASVMDVDFPGIRMAQPEERAAIAGLTLPVKLDSVMRDGRAEVGTPFRLTVITVGAGIGEDVHATIAHLHGQSVGMGMRGDTEKSVRASVAAAPDLRRLLSGRP